MSEWASSSWSGTSFCIRTRLAYLSFALPRSVSSYVLGALLSKFYLGEEIKPARWIGTAVIIAGVLLVAIFGQSGGGGQDKKS